MLRTCTSCGRGVYAPHRYGDPTTISPNECPSCAQHPNLVELLDAADVLAQRFPEVPRTIDEIEQWLDDAPADDLERRLDLVEQAEAVRPVARRTVSVFVERYRRRLTGDHRVAADYGDEADDES